MTTIHQFTPVASYGDGVTGSLLFIQKLLRSLGYLSEIYAEKTPQELSEDILSIEMFDSNPCDLLLIHHSMGHDLEDWIHSLKCPRVVVYHNITPSQYFAPHTEEHFYAVKGRQQLKNWREIFAGAISISPYNLNELLEFNYTNTAVIPLVVDFSRFDISSKPPPASWQVGESEQIILSVGRIVDNKRQHLLIEAFYHLKQMFPEQPARLIIVGGITGLDYHHQLRARIDQLGMTEHVTLTGKCTDEELCWLYQNSAQLWCTSEHEGFCIPLIEANYFHLPVITLSSSNIPDTLGESGILLQENQPLTMAAVSVQMLNSPELTEKVISAGNRNLKRYEEGVLKAQLQTFLASCLPDNS